VRPSDVVAVRHFPGPDVDMLESVSAELCGHGVSATYEVVDGLDAADMLVQMAADVPAALIAVGSHGRSGVSRAALGSVSMRTVRHATCPVLVVGPECTPLA
jgi:nucleotide-binding universal stress UspA family protein